MVADDLFGVSRCKLTSLELIGTSDLLLQKKHILLQIISVRYEKIVRITLYIINSKSTSEVTTVIIFILKKNCDTYLRGFCKFFGLGFCLNPSGMANAASDFKLSIFLLSASVNKWPGFPVK